MSRVRGVLLSFAVAWFAAHSSAAGGAANPTAVKEIQALLNELGYVPGTSSSIDHDTDTALTLFFKADNPPELAGIKFGPGVWDNNLDKCLDALRNALQRARDDQTKPSVLMETPHQDYSVHIAADRAGKSVVSTDGSMIKSWDTGNGRQRWSQTVPGVVAKDGTDGTITVTDDGRYAIIASIAYRVYEIATGKVVKTFWDRVNRFNTLYPAAAIAARPGTSELIVAEGTALEKLVVFDWKTGRFLGEIGPEKSTSVNLTLSADGRYAATTSFDAGIRIWDLANRRLLRSLTVPGALKFQHPLFFKDGRTVAVFGTYALNGKDRSSTLSIFDIEKGLVATREFSYVDYSHYSAAVDENVLYVTGNEKESDRTATLAIDSQGRTVRKMPELDSHDLVVGSPPIGFGMTAGRLAASSFNDKPAWPGSHGTIGYGGFVREADRSSDALLGLGQDLFKLDLSTGSIQSTGRFESEKHSFPRLKGLNRATDDRLAGGFFDEGSGQVQDAQGKVVCKIDVKSKPSDDIVVIDTFDYSKANGLIALWIDSSVALFDDKTCQEQRRIPVDFVGHARAISIMGVQPFPAGFRFSGDGETLYVWRADTAVQSFDPHTGRRLAVYRTDFDNGRASDELSAAFRSASGAGLAPLVHHVLPVPNSKRFVVVITANAFTRNGYRGGLVLSFEEGNPRWTTAYRFPQNLDKWAIDPSGSKLVADLGEFGVHIADLATGREIASFGAQPANIQDISFSSDARHVLILSGDGVLRIFSATTGALLTTSTASSDGSWLAVTPEGFFAGSAGGSNLIRIRRGDTTFEIDQFYQALYRPDLVREKLAGDPRGMVRDAAAALDLNKVIASGSAPDVRVTLPARGLARVADSQAAVDAEISDRGGGIGRVEWRVNGVTAGIDSPAQAAGGQPIRLTRSLNLEAGDNTVEVVAYNSANLIASVPGRIAVAAQVPAASVPAPATGPSTTAPAAAVAANARLFILAAGSDEYADERLRLHYSVPDAKAIAEALADAGKGLYASVETRVLSNTEVTADGLNAAFQDMSQKILPADVFVLHLAGHGKTVDGRYYFVPQNFKLDGDFNDRAVDAAVKAQGIAQEQWQRWFASIPARKSVILFDTCESGTLTSDAGETKSLEQGAANDRLAQATGRSIMTASSGSAAALEGYHGHGLFTYNLLDALNRGDSDNNGTIEVSELAAFVYAQVTAISERVYKQRQEPQMKITANYPLAKQTHILQDEVAPVAEVKPAYQLAKTAQLQIQPNSGATVVRSLSAKTPLIVLESKNGWSLVASEGKPLGYVATRDLAPIP